MVASFFVVALAGFVFSDFLNSLEQSNTSDWTAIGKNNNSPAPTKLENSAILIKNPKVTCDGCDHNPGITTTNEATPTISKNTTTVGRVVISYNYKPENYSLASEKPVPASAIIYDILQRQDLGHLTSNVNIPDVSYVTTKSVFQNNSYTIPVGAIVLARNASLSANFSISVPVISDQQYNALKNTKDYRYVYGLIRGIVGHEELHYQALKNYMNEIATIINTPIATSLTISANSTTEMQNKVDTILMNTIKKRLAEARARHEAAQNAIDSNDLQQKISFEFQDKVNGEIPATIVGEFRGEGTFDFTLPPGPVSKPPTPNITNN